MPTPQRRRVLLSRNTFDPTRVSGLSFWAEADRITSLNDGDAVAQWNDLTVGAKHLTQSTAGQRPLYKVNIINGLPVVRFDGADDQIDNTSFSLAQPYTIFIVAVKNETVGASGPGTLVDSTTSGNQSAFYFGDGTTTSEPVKVANGGTAITGAAQGNGVAKLFAAVINGAASSLYVNNGSATTGSPGSNGLSGLRVGGLRGAPVVGNYWLKGDVALVALWNRALDVSELAYLQAGYGKKYGLF